MPRVGTVTETSNRALGAVALAVGLLVALFALCCTLDADHHSGGDSEQLAVASTTLHVDAGHGAHDCDHPFTVVAAPSAAVLVAAPDAGAPAASAQVPPTGMGLVSHLAFYLSPPLPPVPHLLCVSRT